ncbi:hypothetical protein [Pelagibacterium mangrovi]|uniref:hypothetical protein n=1 Tax=Pelagibacterium mangrovi TaxID=3119828 RepID=UPI002FC84CFB
MINQDFTIPADDRAHHIAQTIAEMIEEIKAGRIDTALTMARDAQEEAQTLCDDLDPCNPHGCAAPLYPDVLGAAKLAVQYGVNVVPFAPR